MRAACQQIPHLLLHDTSPSSRLSWLPEAQVILVLASFVAKCETTISGYRSNNHAQEFNHKTTITTTTTTFLPTNLSNTILPIFRISHTRYSVEAVGVG
ncbi:hypothetical protein E2C01_032010 [Portunus trituberculatus]|uniref:Uncharacterized protein n=1 Tax=Portunus trituberculatus TaxID=210409 RepID=A0A5B7F077_PORTR|nr:hypothetical protein [Portunus trituberculatus]